MTMLGGLHLPHALFMGKQHGGRRSRGEARLALPLPGHAPPSGPLLPRPSFQAEHSAHAPCMARATAHKPFSLSKHLGAKAFCPHRPGLPNVPSVQDLTLAGG